MSILRALGVEVPTQEQIHLAGLLHDIGNIGVKESVLHKPGPLNGNEFEHVKSHTIIAARILRPVIRDTVVADMILHHHERYDGRGYPHGLEGKKIPLGARILAVAESFDAMTSPRPYRPPESVESALKEVQGSAGSHYDPEVVKVFPEVLSRAEWVVQLERDRTHVFLRSSLGES
jgi:HD-GYP domain-containing protein (c-di-GMP phosphodiesterase class II)